MAHVGALHQAMALAAAPLLAGAMRAQPLPDDVHVLIQIVGGDDATLREAVRTSRASAQRVREAAALYIQHVVFSPTADHYRILAVAPDAPQAVIREHVTWLMKWLHPDRLDNDWVTVFAQRVNAAWNDLKTPEKRVRYDRTLPPRSRTRRTSSGKRRLLTPNPRRMPLIPADVAPDSRKLRTRLAVLVVAGLI